MIKISLLVPRILLRLCACSVLIFTSLNVRAEEIHVTPETLATAVRGATGGTTLLLAPGVYAPLRLSGLEGQADAPIVLRSADASDPAQLLRISIENAAHIHFETLILDYRFSNGDPLFMRPFAITGSRNIALRNVVIDGDLVSDTTANGAGYPTGYGISLRNSQGISITQSTIHTFMRGLVANNTSDIILRGNDIHSMRSDGLNFAQVRNVLIEDNNIHDFLRSLDSPDHADMIQFWTNRTTEPSVGITIRNNVLNSGDGAYTQSIFMRNDQVDQGLAGPEMFYRDVLIEGNVILNAHSHGITVGETQGLRILNNTAVRNAGSSGSDPSRSVWVPRILVSEAARDVTIARNVTSMISGYAGQPTWEITDNIMVQDRGRLETNHYSLFFISALSEDSSQISSFAPLPGGPLDGTGIGAPRLQTQ